jgi:hypothetical protein
MHLIYRCFHSAAKTKTRTHKELCVHFYQQKVEKNYNTKITNKSLGNVVQLKYLEMALKYQNCIHGEIKEDLIWGMHATI